MEKTGADLICEALSRHDFEVEGNGRHVKVLCGTRHWVLNFATRATLVTEHQ